ncbi:UNVERIFIED_CONTAM: hypothetical protein RMT77_002352 [Armadillidium vulgare]
MSFINSEETNLNKDNFPKLVDRTIKVSNITRGVPLRKPHFKATDLSQVNKNHGNQNIFKNEMKSAVEEFNKCDESINDFQENKRIDTLKVLKSEPFTPYKISEDIPVVRSEDILLSNSKEPNIDDVQGKISLNGIKSDYGLESESFYVNEVIVKFLQKNLIAKCRFKFTGNEKITFDHPIGVAELKSKEIIVADTFANRLLLFNEKCEFIRQIASSSVLKHPSAIVVLPDGKFAVRNNKEIIVFSPDCTFLKSFGSDFLKKPYGIAEDGQGNVITVDSGNSDSLNIVFIDVTTGNMVKKIPVIDAVKPDQQCTSKPRFITFRHPSTLLVVDLGLDKVFIINVRTGIVVKSFGSSGNGIGQFRDPSGIACEADGFILVGDSRNHRIQIFTPCGEFVCVLRLDRPLRRPSGISLTQDGHLFVLNYWENSLVKYQFCSHE